MIVQKFTKLFLLFILLTVSSCLESIKEKFGSGQDRPTQIRIVDLNGNPRPIKTFVPEGNIQALSDQEKVSAEDAQNNYVRSKNAMTPEVPYVAQDDLSTIPAPAVNPNVQQDVEKDSDVVLSYDMSEDKQSEVKTQNTAQSTVANEQAPTKKFKFSPKSEKAPVKTAAKVNTQKSSGREMFVQIASFSTKSSAQETLNKNSGISSGRIQEVTISGKKNYRVLLGPVSNNQSLTEVLNQSKNAGYKDAFIVK